MKYLLGFLGTGNMGSALVKSAAQSIVPSQICIYDHNAEKTEKLKNDLGVNVSNNEIDLVSSCQFLVLGIKPQMLDTVAGTIKSAVQKSNVKIISMLASVDINRLSSVLGEREYIRIMPNTPVLLGEGVVLYSTKCSGDSENTFTSAFEKAGKLVKITEEDMDAGMSVSGCGPAFVYMFIDAMAKAGEKLGLDKDVALALAVQTVKGSAMMVEEFFDPERLKINVCSPGGTTIEGVKSLENARLNSIVENALKASFDKAKILAKK